MHHLIAQLDPSEPTQAGAIVVALSGIFGLITLIVKRSFDKKDGEIAKEDGWIERYIEQLKSENTYLKEENASLDRQIDNLNKELTAIRKEYDRLLRGKP